MFSARKWTPVDFFCSHYCWFRYPGQNTGLNVSSFRNTCERTLFQAARLVDKIRSRLFRCVATARWNSRWICSAKTRFVSLFGMCYGHVPSQMSAVLWRSTGVWFGRNCRMRFRHVCSMLCLVQTRSLTYKDFCIRIRVARQMDAKSLLHEPCSHHGSEKTLRQLKLDHKLRQPVNAGKLFRDLSESTRNFLRFVGQVMLASHLCMWTSKSLRASCI